MRPAAWLMVASVALAGETAHGKPRAKPPAKVVHHEALWIAASKAPEAIVVGVLSWSEDPAGINGKTSWVFHQPAGVVHATIADVDTGVPFLKQANGAKLDDAKIKKLIAGLAAATQGKPPPSKDQLQQEAQKLGLEMLAAAPTCPATIELGKKRVSVKLGAATGDGGTAREWDRKAPTPDPPSLEPTCHPHAGGVIVRFTMHSGIKGHTYEDRLAFVRGATLP